ncbi:hypothetical protein CU098_000119, partial [Rhizopus stolonifer]
MAIPLLNKRGTGVHLDVQSESDFCSYLPPKQGQLVAATEEDASPFCTVAKDYAAAFPLGFIQSAHFLRTKDFFQVTGKIDHTKYNLISTDGGGQYDHKDLPHGTCNGLKYFVNLVEPDSNVFCIRCCQKKKDCNTGISTQGCRRIVP